MRMTKKKKVIAEQHLIQHPQLIGSVESVEAAVGYSMTGMGDRVLCWRNI